MKTKVEMLREKRQEFLRQRDFGRAEIAKIIADFLEDYCSSELSEEVRTRKNGRR